MHEDRLEGEAHEYLLAEDLVGNYAKDLGYESADEAIAAISRTHTGAELEGISYDRLWDYYADTEAWGTQNAWRILVADYVSTTDGTGIVHQAPAYGEEDQKICEAAGIPVVISVDEGARFVSSVPDVAGLQVFEANKPLTQLLRANGRLLRQASYEHSYPHCWRCRNPLIYKAVSSWFVRVTEFRDRMETLNQEINWIPENVKDGQFGKWVSNARDWSISRNRYWGSPIPVWKSDNPEYPRVDVYGSLDELEADFGVRPTDLHRPFIDELTRPNPDDPTGSPRCAASKTCSTCGSTPARCRSRRCTTRSRTRSGSTATTRPTSSWSTSGRPGVVLHAAHAVDGVVRPPGVPQRGQSWHRARKRRPEDVEEPAQLSGCLRGARPRRL